MVQRTYLLSQGAHTAGCLGHLDIRSVLLSTPSLLLIVVGTCRCNYNKPRPESRRRRSLLLEYRLLKLWSRYPYLHRKIGS